MDQMYERASKVAVAILTEEGADPQTLERWFSEDRDVRSDPKVGREILDLLRLHGVKSVVMTDRIIGCPHEQGADYPEGAVCPQNLATQFGIPGANHNYM